ncbi:hypothetical protein E2C01_094551 [Portunus trituberculatus]|uniref:Uncharacterized protein n=1 Tax=Portunus trituberculatus TaxID=210409 RepID=A0A5B7JX62_PORTR|nr:hypothetical protein [Portunus trituberculatus]
MDPVDHAILAVGLYAIALQNKRKRKARIWTRRWLARRQESLFRNLVQELSLEDEEGYRKFMRLNKLQFHEILELVRQAITKQDTNMRKAVTAEECLAITLW